MAAHALSRNSLWKITVTTAPAAEDAVSVLLARLFGVSPAIFTDPERDGTEVSVFLAQRADWTPRRRRDLELGLQELQRAGLPLGSGRIVARQIRREDWAESWKKHFRPLVIGGQLLLKPSWSARQPRVGQVVVVLDPGLSFGTGQHPTTRFCLEQLVAFRQSMTRPSMLDVGTGSGILAIAAAKLGYAPVRAVECDPDAVRIARRNAARNRTQQIIQFRRVDLAQLPVRPRGQHDLVCANLISDLVLEQRQRLVGQLKAGGRLVLAGILQSQFAAVRQAYEAAGLRLVARQKVGEWESGAFDRPAGCPRVGQSA